jgi:GntR family transcriptional regulator / MocR family aminotransferase
MFLELDGQGPKYQQLGRALQQAMAEGRLAPGARLPSTRDLAHTLRLSRNTVRSAYDHLAAGGVIAGRHGSGSYTLASPSKGPPAQPAAPPAALPPQSRFSARTRAIHDYAAPRIHRGLRFNLQYGEPLTDVLLPDVWKRELARAASYTRLGYPPMQGLPELRQAVARYLHERRGIVAEADDIVIVAGTQQALSLAARVLLDEGAAAVMEDPGYFAARWALAAHGATLIPVPVDRGGLVVERLPEQRPGLIYVTPTHQFPLGVALAARRRAELLRYAKAQRTWIVEDDYDGELNFDGPAVRPLRAMAGGEQVIHVGSFSKVLAPSLRLAYLVAPRALRDDFVSAKLLCDLGCSAIEQAALAGLLTSGGFERHLRRVVRALRSRRNALVAGLRRHAAPHLRFDVPTTGMHLVAWQAASSRLHLPTLIRVAAGSGIGLHPLGPHAWAHEAAPALLLGYAGLSAAEITLACRLLGPCIEQALREGPS